MHPRVHLVICIKPLHPYHLSRIKRASSFPMSAAIRYSLRAIFLLRDIQKTWHRPYMRRR